VVAYFEDVTCNLGLVAKSTSVQGYVTLPGPYWYSSKGCAPAIAGIWGREGGGRQGLIQIKIFCQIFRHI